MHPRTSSPTRLKRLALVAAALATVAASLPAAAAAGPDDRTRRPSDGGLSAVIRTTEYGIPHIVAKDYASPGFGTGWAQAADEVCTPAGGFVTVNGERSRWFGADAPADSSMPSATENLSSDLFFQGVKDAGTVEALLATPAPAGPGTRVKELMRGYAAGYHGWLRRNRITRPGPRGRRVGAPGHRPRRGAPRLGGGRAPRPGARPRCADEPAPAHPNAVDLRMSDTALGFARSRSTRELAETPRRTQGLPWVNTIAADSAGHTLFTQARVLPRITDEPAECCSAPLGRHQFVVRNGERIPVSGGADALGVWNCTNARWDPAGGGYTEVVAGSSHIQAVGWDGSGCPVARTLLTYSQSDDPGSAHFSDQTRLFSDGRWVTSRYCEKEILSSPALKVVTVGE